MVFEYHSDTDVLYIKLAGGISVESEQVAPGLVLDFGKDHRIIGVEVEDASKFVDLTRLELGALPIADLFLRESVLAGS